MSKVRGFAAAVSFAMLLVSAPIGARAGYCASNTVIFSYWASTTPAGSALNPDALYCLVDDSMDLRTINPGTDAISIRYIVDLGADIKTLTATLDGLGFENQSVTLTRNGSLYDSDLLPIGNVSGCITAVIYDPADTEFIDPLDVTTFHTIDQQSTGCGG